jgi:hypothetical protein
MSNHLAIATVTNVLGQNIGSAVGAAVPGAAVTTLRPDAPGNGSTPQARVNLYLYQTLPNAAWRSSDLPTRGAQGEMTQRPQAALNLHYLLTFFGDESRLEPQRLLGSAVTALQARPVLTREAIRGVIRTAVAADPDHYLAGSDLAEQVELVKFSPLPLNLEELSKLWSVFFQTPYALSAAYQGSVVLLESDGTPQLAAPVRERNIYVGPRRRPLIEELLSRADSDGPIIADRPIDSNDHLVIKGMGLLGPATQVFVGGVEATSLQEVGNTHIVLALPAHLRAGTRSVQVVHRTPRWSAESNAVAFELLPHIISVSAANVQGSSGAPRSADITVRLRPEVGRTQRVALLLNERFPPETRTPRSYVFDALPRTSTALETSTSLTIPVSEVVAGQYVVRLRVDGAESLLGTTSSGEYSTPEVEIP